MNLNNQLRKQLDEYEKTLIEPRPEVVRQERQPKPQRMEVRKVVGGDILRKPIDKASAMIVAKAPWWAHPPTESTPAPTVKPVCNPQTTNQTKKLKHMKEPTNPSELVPNCEYVSRDGIRVKMINGEPHLSLEDIDRVICEQISKLPAETRPNVLAAQDARKIVRELLDGIGGEMEKFNASSKVYLEDIRRTRFAVVSETASMTKELKEVRQFFLGSDYKDQIARLTEFVDLCERLQKLKQNGFLDSVADTMLKLA